MHIVSQDGAFSKKYVPKTVSSKNLRYRLWLTSHQGKRSETSNLLMIQRSKYTYRKATVVNVREIYAILENLASQQIYVVFIYVFLSVKHL